MTPLRASSQYVMQATVTVHTGWTGQRARQLRDAGTVQQPRCRNASGDPSGSASVPSGTRAKHGWRMQCWSVMLDPSKLRSPSR